MKIGEDMIEIIQNGKDKKYKATCPKCDTDISYTKEDIKTRTRELKGFSFIKSEDCGFLGLRTKKYKETPYHEKAEDYITCPCCGETIVIGEYIKQFNKRVEVEEL